MNPTKANLHTIFRWCNDIDAMRQFYTHLLGLDETFYRNDEEHGWLTYQLEDLQLVFTRAASALPIEDKWADSPAYPGGTAPVESWMIACNAHSFAEFSKRLQQHDTPIYDGILPHPDSMILVRDPMGMTIEIWHEPGEGDT